MKFIIVAITTAICLWAILGGMSGPRRPQNDGVVRWDSSNGDSAHVAENRAWLVYIVSHYRDYAKECYADSIPDLQGGWGLVRDAVGGSWNIQPYNGWVHHQPEWAGFIEFLKRRSDSLKLN